MSQYSKYSPTGGGGGGGGVTSINSQAGPSVSIVAGTGISVVSGSNIITITNTGAGVEYVEYRIVTSGEAAAKSLTLTAGPATPANTFLDIVGGTSQIYSTDFTVSGTSLSWLGLGLDGLLSAGDILRIEYLS